MVGKIKTNGFPVELIQKMILHVLGKKEIGQKNNYEMALIHVKQRKVIALNKL